MININFRFEAIGEFGTIEVDVHWILWVGHFNQQQTIVTHQTATLGGAKMQT